jgi:hypothetical protein
MAPGGRESRTEGRRGESAGAATDPTSERQGADQSRLHHVSVANGSFYPPVCVPHRHEGGRQSRKGLHAESGAGAQPSDGTGHRMAQ